MLVPKIDEEALIAARPNVPAAYRGHMRFIVEAYEAAKLLHQPVERTDYAWVIESTNSSPSRPKYWRGNGTEHEAECWNFDHKEAMQFNSEAHAKNYAEGMHLSEYRICQHGWETKRESGELSEDDKKKIIEGIGQVTHYHMAVAVLEDILKDFKITRIEGGKA